jgi:hypothetical protein
MPLKAHRAIPILGEVWPRRSFAPAQAAVVVREGMAEGFMAVVAEEAEGMAMATDDRAADGADLRSAQAQPTAAFPTSRWTGGTTSREPLAKCRTANRSASSRRRWN